MKVPFVDLKYRYEEEKAEILECLDTVLAKGHLVLTEEVAKFEQEVGEYIGSENVVALNSGTDALMMALWALGIGRGDEVITTAVSFVASVGAIVHVGARPVLVDIGADFNIDPGKIEEAITSKTKAIMPVHWGGRIANMQQICAIANKYNIGVIEDSAQGMGAFLNGRHGGTFGDLAGFSAHPLKNLNAIGDAGFLATKHADLADKIRVYRNHGLESRDNCVFYGVNSRLDSLQAEILRFRLRKLEDVVSRRRLNVSIYQENLKCPEIFIPKDTENSVHAYVMFLVQAERRDDLKAYLDERNIESMVYYGTPLHMHKAAARFGYAPGDFPEAEKHCEKVLALPHHQNLSEEQIRYVCHQVNRFYE